MTNPRALPETIYIDYSIFSAHQLCKEKSRLSYVENLRPLVTAPPLDFGSAWHAGLEALYVNEMNLEMAKAAFVQELRDRGSALPISIDSDEKRSVERGLAMLEAYVERWRGEPYRVIRRPDTGAPYVEIGFAIYIMDWRGIPVFYVGRIDRMMQSTLTTRIVNVESKTSSQSLNVFMKQIRPNNQVTGYHLAAKRLGLPVEETLWDAAFVSSRQPNPKKGGWMAWGIEIETDFARTTTRRSDAEIEDFLNNDLIPVAWEWCEARYANPRARWSRSAPGACHSYGGCQFRDVCSTNLNPDLIRSNFKVEIWEPWRGITEDRVVRA